MPVTIGSTENTFANPIGLLTDCHRRIERFLQVLLKIATDPEVAALDAPHRNALEAALKYFRDSAPKHTADEEDDLFPALRDAAGQRAKDALERLESDHKNADAWHREVDEIGERWLRDDRLAPHDAFRLKTLLHSLADLYRAHIAVEEEQIFPLAQAELSDSAKQAIGKRMASRRGAPFIPHP
ncbi:MAG TPA: hemerythrin domain-containing protein [Bryobacteraceae bacterium]|nr:hemerythrin domain-containing protein [Bryobacteraceae bacterium]